MSSRAKGHLRDISEMQPKSIDGVPPPHDLDAEAAVLSATLLDYEALDRVVGVVTPADFYSEAHRLIFAACERLHAEGKPVDVVTVGTALKDADRITQIGGMAYLTEILNSAPAVANVRAYAVTVRDKARLRALARECQRISAAVYVGQVEDTQQFLEESESKVAELTRAPESSSVEDAAPIIKSVFAEIAKSAETGTTPATKTGFARCDALMGGVEPGELIVIAARPGMGKSAWTQQVCANVADGQDSEGYDQGAFFFGMEMPRRQVVRRVIAQRARVSVRKLKESKTLSQSDWTRLHEAATHLSKLALRFDDQPAQNVLQIRAKIRQARADFACRKRPARLKVVVVDYLQLMKSISRNADAMSREAVVAEVARGLKGIALGENIPVIALAQLNRDLEKRTDKRPKVSDLRESGEIENAADKICFIYREDHYAQERANASGYEFVPDNIAEFNWAKFRDGGKGMVKLRFDTEYARFDDLAEAWE